MSHCEGNHGIGCEAYRKLHADLPCEERDEYPCEEQGYPYLFGTELEQKLRIAVRRNLNYITNALREQDELDFWMVERPFLRKVLEKYCFPMTNPQWEEVMDPFPYPLEAINYVLFLDCYRYRSNIRIPRCFNTLSKTVLKKNSFTEPLLHDDMLRIVREGGREKRDALLADFAFMDKEGTGQVGRDYFRHILKKHVVSLNQMSFYNLYYQIPTTDEGCVKYKEFLDDFCAPDAMPAHRPFSPAQSLLCRDCPLPFDPRRNPPPLVKATCNMPYSPSAKDKIYRRHRN